jgi:ABC-type molybdate transport system substrate-binding protein
MLLLTLTLSATGDEINVVATASYPPLEQGCVVLTSSKKKPAALAFVEFLKKPETVELLKRSGFGN